jgi:CspA family cold shock protein
MSELIHRTFGKKTGVVKWFNPSRGYGFITNIDKDSPDIDLFCHHTSLSTIDNVYKTLTQGEYINYDEKTENGKLYAENITGIYGGRLLCEIIKKNDNHNDDDSK